MCVAESETVMDLLTSLSVFLRVAETESFSRAAEGLDLSRPKVSRLIKELEEALGVRLFYRTTRKVTLTAEGEELLRRGKSLLASSNKLVRDLRDQAGKPLSGHLRISSSVIIAWVFIQGVVAKFLADHPGVSIELVTADREMRLPEEGIDLAFRVSNKLKDTLIARRIGSVRSILAAAPSVFKGRKMPETIEELRKEPFLANYFFGSYLKLIAEDGRAEKIDIRGRYSSQNTLLMFNACLQGGGIAMFPTSLAQPYIDRGELVRVMPGWVGEELGFYALYTDQSLSRVGREFLAAVMKALEPAHGHPYDAKVRAGVRLTP